MRRRQAAWEIAPDLDPAMFQIAVMGLILAPLSLPHIMHELTGLEASDPEFVRGYGEQATRMLRHLAG